MLQENKKNKYENKKREQSINKKTQTNQTNRKIKQK